MGNLLYYSFLSKVFIPFIYFNDIIVNNRYIAKGHGTEDTKYRQ